MSTVSKYEKIAARLEHDGQVLRIVLASPPANILDAQAMAEIGEVLDTEGTKPAVKAIVFEGEGKHFCFGASVPEHTKERCGEMIAGFHGLFKKLLSLDVPLVALVRGQCLGGGMELAAFCSVIIADEKAKFGQPEIQLAVFPPVAALILPDIVGQARADDLVITGRSIEAKTARKWGLVHEVTEDCEQALQGFLAKQILPKSASSLRFAVRAVRSGWKQTLPARLDEMERLYVQELMETADANEGIGAFLEKRQPRWQNG